MENYNSSSILPQLITEVNKTKNELSLHNKNINDISQIKSNDNDKGNHDDKTIKGSEVDSSMLKSNLKADRKIITNTSFFSPKSGKSAKKHYSPVGMKNSRFNRDNFEQVNSTDNQNFTNFQLKLNKEEVKNKGRKVVNVYHKIVDKNRRRFNEIYKITPELIQDIKDVQKLKKKLDLEQYQNNLVI